MNVTLMKMPAKKDNTFNTLRAEVELDNGARVNISPNGIKIININDVEAELVGEFTRKGKGSSTVSVKYYAVKLFGKEPILFKVEGISTNAMSVKVTDVEVVKHGINHKCLKVTSVDFTPSTAKTPDDTTELLRNTYEAGKPKTSKSKTEIKLKKAPVVITINH